MPFTKILKNLVETTPGADGAILADWEGEAVAHFCRFDEFELKVIAAHKGIILNQIREIQQGLTLGELEETVITTTTHHVIVGPVGKDYSVVMTLVRDSVVGRGVFHFKDAVRLLKKEIY